MQCTKWQHVHWRLGSALQHMRDLMRQSDVRYQIRAVLPVNLPCITKPIKGRVSALRSRPGQCLTPADHACPRVFLVAWVFPGLRHISKNICRHFRLAAGDMSHCRLTFYSSDMNNGLIFTLLRGLHRSHRFQQWIGEGSCKVSCIIASAVQHCTQCNFNANSWHPLS